MLTEWRHGHLGTHYPDMTLLLWIWHNARSYQKKLIRKTQSATKKQPVQQNLLDISTTECIFTAAFVHQAPNKTIVRRGQHQVNNMSPLYCHSAHTRTLSVLQVKARCGVRCCGCQVARASHRLAHCGNLHKFHRLAATPPDYLSALPSPIPQPASSRAAVTWELAAPRECTQGGREMEGKRKACEGGQERE